MRPGPLPLFGARALAEWARAGGRPERRIQAYLPRLWWHGFWFEHNWQAQVARLKNTCLPDDPVFVVGLWRSGTTAFHQLLAAVTGWATPQTWQCFNPSTCFLVPPPRDASVVRPMDQGRISTRSPQEDEFARLLLGEPSVYRALIDPRRLNQCAELFWSSTEVGLERWEHFLRGVTLDATGIRLLLKSPSHTFRLPLLRSLFSRAKFIWIARDPSEVLASNQRMWRAMMGLYALWECPPGMLESFLEDMLRACAQVLNRCLEEMTAERMLWVDFEELQLAPRAVLERSLAFLEVDDSSNREEWARNIDRALARFPIYRRSEAPRVATRAGETLQEVMILARQRFGAMHRGSLAFPERSPQ